MISLCTLPQEFTDNVEEPNLYRDLDDIKFAGMPWSLEGSLQQELNIDETLHPEYRQLYTRGFDSFLLSQNLRELSLLKIFPSWSHGSAKT